MRRYRAVLCLSLLFALTLASLSQTAPGPATSSASTQLDEQTAKDLHYAIDLYKQGKTVEALPWFEKVVAAAPDNAGAREGLGFCLIGKADTLTDPAQRKATRIRARQELLRAKELGDNSDLVNVSLSSLPEDGGDPVFSDNAEIDRVMKQGEAAFAAGNWDDAKKAYLQALVLDPKSYEAMLFMGDVYFRKGDPAAASEWFTRATQVDPTRETAYRYWGDALMSQGNLAGAREKFIQDYLCNPYDQRAALGISNYLHQTKQKVTWYKFQSPDSFNATEKGGTINVDSASLDKKDGSSAWMVYPMERMLWKKETFAKEFPDEKQYRHSLKEESAALGAVAASADELARGKKAEKLNPDLQALVKLNQAGLLDAYILINAPDAGIAQDYPAYRRAHGDLLVRYMSEVVVPAPPAN